MNAVKRVVSAIVGDKHQLDEPVVSANRNTPQQYHTRTDCPNFPEAIRDVREDDHRRNVRQCQVCVALEGEH